MSDKITCHMKCQVECQNGCQIPPTCLMTQLFHGPKQSWTTSWAFPRFALPLLNNSNTLSPWMECEFEGGKFDDFIIQDPYLFPAAHGGRLVGLWCNGGLCGLLAVLIWLPWFRPKMKDRLKIKLCSRYAFLTSCGNSLEALATCVLSENETGRKKAW